jgi:peptidoglycan/LPS O-acetylase OafA/YrhL
VVDAGTDEPLRTSNFFIRRFFRIAPLYYAAIVFYLVWRTVIGGFVVPPQYDVLGIASNMLFLHGFYPEANNSIVPGGWSTATEMTFYVCFPLLFAGMQNRYGRALALPLLVAFCGLAEWGIYQINWRRAQLSLLVFQFSQPGPRFCHRHSLFLRAQTALEAAANAGDIGGDRADSGMFALLASSVPWHVFLDPDGGGHSNRRRP